jgi:DsbC/DsbD-like thiol-disulfide interchange protein
VINIFPPMNMFFTQKGFAYDRKSRKWCDMTLTKSAILALALCAVSNLSYAAASDWATSGQTRMRLVVAEPAPGEKTIRAALQVELAPGWKTYWQDPGEAGVPLQLDLTGSKNVDLKSIHYPAPRRFDDGVTEWAGYNESVLFALEMERGDAAMPGLLATNVFIGICENICVPFQTTFTLNIENAAASTADQMAVQAAFAVLPPMANDKFGITSMKPDGDIIRIEATLPDATKASELFLAAPAGWQFGTPRLAKSVGATAHFEAAVLFAPKDGFPDQLPVFYTLVSADGAVSGTGILTK